MFTSELAWIKSMSAVESVGGGGRKAGTEPLNGGRKAGIAPLNGGSGGTSGGSGTLDE
jgi:hypothetical protein